MSETIKIGVLISGGGTNLQALIDACEDADFPAEIALVLSNKASAKGLERAKKAGISHFVVDHKKYPQRRDFDAELHKWLKEARVDLVCLAGFMRILSPSFIREWRGRILNIHPSLLPKFGGEGMYGHHVHEAVIRAHEIETGATVHIVTEDCDLGPTVLQRAIPVYRFDTAETLAGRVLDVEHQIYPQAVAHMAEIILDERRRPRHDMDMNADHHPVKPDQEAILRAQQSWNSFVSMGKISIIAIAAVLVFLLVAVY